MSKSLYTVAGVSTHNGETKVRYANNMHRVRHLERVGHTNVMMVELPFEGTTVDAVDYLLGIDKFATLPCVIQAAQEMGFLGVEKFKSTAVVSAV